MQEFIAAINDNTGKQITIVFYRKNDGVISQMADAVYTLYISSIVNTEKDLDLTLTNGATSDGKTDVHVKIPQTASFTSVTSSEWHVEFDTPTTRQVIKILFPAKIVETPTQVHVNKPSIKEIRNEKDELVRLYIETPEEGATMQFLNQISQVIDQLMKSWNIIRVTTDNSEIEFKDKSVKYDSIELVTIPGNNFFELYVESEQGIEQLEMATTISIDIEHNAIEYTLDDVSYKVSKSL